MRSGIHERIERHGRDARRQQPAADGLLHRPALGPLSSRAVGCRPHSLTCTAPKASRASSSQRPTPARPRHLLPGGLPCCWPWYTAIIAGAPLASRPLACLGGWATRGAGEVKKGGRRRTSASRRRQAAAGDGKQALPAASQAASHYL